MDPVCPAAIFTGDYFYQCAQLNVFYLEVSRKLTVKKKVSKAPVQRWKLSLAFWVKNLQQGHKETMRKRERGSLRQSKRKLQKKKKDKNAGRESKRSFSLIEINAQVHNRTLCLRVER